jgi:N-hydroxyarylamine O-acetyltransferase
VEYWFTLTPRRLDEFAGMCRFHQTSPESHFTRKPVATLAMPDGGRISLVDRTFGEERGAEKTERELAGDEIARVLIERFDLADAVAIADRFTSR